MLTDGFIESLQSGPYRHPDIPDPDRLPPSTAFELGSVAGSDGRALAVAETQTDLGPFATLTRLRTAASRDERPILIVMPMSGHYGISLYDMVAGLLCSHEVALLDWTNAKDVPAAKGSFGFEDSIAAICAGVHMLGRPVNLIGLCQSTVPAIAAAAAVRERADPTLVASLTLMGGPVDPMASPTRVAMVLTATPLAWFEHVLVREVGADQAGAGRLVYPGRTQQDGILTYLRRKCIEGDELADKLTEDDGSRPAQFPFLRLVTGGKSIPAVAFIESIAAIYKRRSLWQGAIQLGPGPVDMGALIGVPILTIEAPGDDIAAPGQTAAAHDLVPGPRHPLSRAVLISGGGHFSLGHGRRCRKEVVPLVRDFVDAASSHAQCEVRRSSKSTQAPAPQRARDVLVLNPPRRA